MASQKDDAPPPPPLRRLSTATGREVTDEVIEVASRVFRERELPTLGFELGVLNTIAKTMVFAAAPQFLWLYALFEYPVLLVLVARSWAKSNNLLYFAEFCWIANSAGFLYLGFEALHALGGKGLDGSLETVLWMGPALRHSAARAFFAVANGPLAMTVLINKNALVFHDIERTAGFFIHFTPALVSWTMRWRFAEPVSSCEKPSDPLAGFLRLLPFSSDATAPTLTPSSLFAFNQATLVTTDASGDLLQSAVALYLVWWLGYAAWLLTIGYDLPNRGWGASSLNDAAPAIAKLYRVPKSRPRAQAVAYLLSHGTAVSIMLAVLPPLCYNSFALHTAWILTLALSAVHQGARYYHHSFGPRLHKALQQALDAELKKK